MVLIHLTVNIHKLPQILLLLGILGIVCIFFVSCKQPTALKIDIWYGSNQRFKERGTPQKWINILGNVSSDNGIASLKYSLNNGTALPLSIGPDGFRLAYPGDFNIEIDTADLMYGSNTIKITAVDSLQNTVKSFVSVHYAAEHPPRFPYTIDWSKVPVIQEAVQVVDGHWKLEADGIRILEPYYDRIIALGDLTWTDYEITVQVTFHGFRQPEKGVDGGAGVIHAAIASRWPGHDEDGKQPRVKWYPLGATAEFRLIEGNPDDCRWRIIGDGGKEWKVVNEETGRPIKLGVRYVMKSQVETLADSKTMYSVKFWKDGEKEPEQWDLQAMEGSEDIQSGGVLLIAHYTDVTFGNVTVNPLSEKKNKPNF